MKAPTAGDLFCIQGHMGLRQNPGGSIMRVKLLSRKRVVVKTWWLAENVDTGEQNVVQENSLRLPEMEPHQNTP